MKKLSFTILILALLLAACAPISSILGSQEVPKRGMCQTIMPQLPQPRL